MQAETVYVTVSDCSIAGSGAPSGTSSAAVSSVAISSVALSSVALSSSEALPSTFISSVVQTYPPTSAPPTSPTTAPASIPPTTTTAFSFTNTSSTIANATSAATVVASGVDKVNWDALPTSFSAPPAPIPTPNPVTDSMVSVLVETMQDKVLQDYNTYSTLSCLFSGDTFSCDGPWLYGDQWSNTTLSDDIFNTSSTDPYVCSSDLTYLQPGSQTRNVYGFSADNITSSFTPIANSASLYATYVCSQNDTCAGLYSNNTEQMFSDYSNYINSTFFAYMAETLPKYDSVYCPPNVNGYSSLFRFMTSFFDGSTEYFGIHNAISMPGVADSINGTVNEIRAEFADILGNNGLKAEGVYLNMVFFDASAASSAAKRSADEEEEEEVYPGCPRREWVFKGACDGVIPPRKFDRAGRVLSMKERDYMEVVSGLVLRQDDSSCGSQQQSIQNTLNEITAAQTALNGASKLAAAVAYAVYAGEVAGAVLPAESVMALLLGYIAVCSDLNACGGLPPSLVSAVQALLKNPNTKKAVSLLESLGVELPWLEANLGSGPGQAIIGGLTSAIGDMLSGAQAAYQAALECCQADCSSAVCSQAAGGCLKDWGVALFTALGGLCGLN